MHLEKLLKRGWRMHLGFLIEYGYYNWVENMHELIRDKKPLSFRFCYDEWFSDSQALIGLLQPSDIEKFRNLYKNENGLTSDPSELRIHDFLTGSEVMRANRYAEKVAAVKHNFEAQLGMLENIRRGINDLSIENI